MQRLCENLDKAILAVVLKGYEPKAVEGTLEELAFECVDYIQKVGKRSIGEPVNRRLSLLKNLLADTQCYPRGFEFYQFFANACDVYENRFDYANYISEILLHSTPAYASYQEGVCQRLREMSYITARLFMTELERETHFPLRLKSCLQLISSLDQSVSDDCKHLLRAEREWYALLEEGHLLMKRVMQDFSKDPRYFVVHCSLLPSSAERSEILFLSVVQLNEILFGLWAEGMRRILAAVDEGALDQECLDIAQIMCKLGQISLGCVGILNDFTHEEFMLFRESTTNAGAIQSRKYKELEIYTNRFVKDRVEQKGFDFVPFFKDLCSETRLHLYDRIQSCAEQEKAKLLKVKLDQFEKTMLDWKRFHLHVARTRLLNHGAPQREQLDHYLASGIRKSFRTEKS